MTALGTFLAYLGLAAAAALLVVALLIKPLCYLIECDARRRYLRAARRRHRSRKGYLPIFDECWHPDIGIAGKSPEGDAAWEQWKTMEAQNYSQRVNLR